MNIAVLYNKPTARFLKETTFKDAEDDTEESANEVLAALTKKGANAHLVSITEDTLEETVSAIKDQLVFNLIEWTGVDTPIAMKTFDLFQSNGICITGCTKENYRDSCDKLLIKKLCRKFDLPTADWQEFVTGDEPIDGSLTYPMLVKVSREHSSAGIAADSVVHNDDELRRIVKARIDEFRQPVFAETFLKGREFQVTLLAKENGLVVLPISEIVYKDGHSVPLLTYAARWDALHHDYSNSTVALAQLSASKQEHLASLCKKAFKEMEFRDYSRFDMRCDSMENPYFLELNANPGLSDDPEYGMTVSYNAAGMTFADFIWEIVLSAKRRYGM